MNNDNLKVSIIIPTWNRKLALVNCIKKIYTENISKNDFEVIICDSFSTDGTEKYVNHFIAQGNIQNLKILQCEHNNVSLKRNMGIQYSAYENIILIDDECIPFENYIKNFIRYFLKCDSYTIICGQYRTKKSKLKKSNYLMYRDSRNFKSNYNNSNLNELQNLDYKRIVTGNLGFKKKYIIERQIYFNSNIIGYGGEDVDWAWRLIENGFKIIKSDIKVFHNETSNSIFFLENLDDKIYKKIFLLILRALFNKIVINLILFYLTITDKNKLFYVSILYKIVLFRAYIDGIYARKNKKKLNQSDTKIDWYSEGYK